MTLLSDISLVIALDDGHYDELDFALKTWEKYKPELFSLKKYIIYDSEMKKNIDKLRLTNCELIRFEGVDKYDSRREAMLTSFFYAFDKIKTKYFIKIDTDCYANNFSREWIDQIMDIEKYCFISSPWGYTKNPQMFYDLENWADNNHMFQNSNRLNHTHKEGSNKIIHRRIISFFYIGNTQWHKEIANLCLKDGLYKLPCPSQDTFCWYCAERLNLPYKTIKFKRYGFSHGRLKKHMDKIKI